MTREQAKELLPIIQAFAEGRVVEFLTHDNKWEDSEDLSFCKEPEYYRIKSEPKYRPFKTKEECWQEMHKHPDFGWVKSKQWGSYSLLGNIGKFIIRSTNECHNNSMNCMYEEYTFTDGTPFGIKKE